MVDCKMNDGKSFALQSRASGYVPHDVTFATFHNAALVGRMEVVGNESAALFSNSHTTNESSCISSESVPLPTTIEQSIPPSNPPCLATSRKRHGACNQHKMKTFVRWLHDNFFDEGSGANGLDKPYYILDVAGGKGELAARLTMCHGMNVTMVDPREADIPSVYLRDVVPRLPSKWQDRLKERTKVNPHIVQDTVKERFRQLVMHFTNESVVQEPLKSAVESCTLLIGVHADSATECIVDVALLHNKPFVVIPCCVFPNLFQQRYLRLEDNGSTRVIPVRSCEQFCEYLLQKDSRCRKSVLPFDGRNVAIWWDGKSHRPEATT
jgi:hypothetical protein